ncbi:MAG: hypothetical protein LBE13_00660 [Bacteroidales bacterium]|nr:hypothetical protein [Bacteroidales bacterium]
MIAKEHTNNRSNKPILTGAENTTLKEILKYMSSAVIPFKKAYSQPNLCHPLNENQTTQIFVEQIEVQIKPIESIGVKNQYSDVFLGTKGIPDFYFHKVEEGITHFPLFVVEAKRLPAPDKRREKEYVVGNKENGGIKRYKIEKHGKGLSACGMIGFVEKENFHYWQTTINKWIVELANTTDFWESDEMLIAIDNEEHQDYIILNSIVHRIASENVFLYHLWINI